MTTLDSQVELPPTSETVAMSRAGTRPILRAKTSYSLELGTSLPLRKQVTFVDSAKHLPLTTVHEVEQIEYPVPVSKNSCCAIL